MKAKHRWLHLSLGFCLGLGGAAILLVVSSAGVQAQDTQPPVEGIELVTPESASTSTALAQEDGELRAALEAARRQGPEAVVALLDTLRGRGLDLVNNEILEAQAQLAYAAPPLPKGEPLSPDEEAQALQAQLAIEAANRTQALAIHTGLGEDEPQRPDISYPVSPNVPAADLTVGSAPCTYATIHDAAVAANPGDRLLIEGGATFTENLYIDKSLTFQGGYSGCGSGSTERTTIDGGDAARVMYFYQNLTVTLENLNITNGNTIGNGAGISALENTQLFGNNLEIYNNTTSGVGGGVRLLGSRATFTNTNIDNNAARMGAGVYGEEYNGYPAELYLASNADVYDNAALIGDGWGGGVYMLQGSVSLANCSDIYSNEAIQGGGAYILDSSLTVTGDCSEIQSNTAISDGGGIFAQYGYIYLRDQAKLSVNQAGYGGGPGNGGGAYLDHSSLHGDKALITHNTANGFGGGVYATNESLLDMDLGGYACSGPRCSQLSYNRATDSSGGGVYAGDGSLIDLRQTFIENNSASIGGGIFAYTSTVYLYNTLIARNDATTDIGDGVRLFADSNFIGAHNTLANNDAGGTATGNAINLQTAHSLTLTHSIVWGHATSINLDQQRVTCSDIEGYYSGQGNMDEDPLFIDPANDDYHLQISSPVIDRCIAAGQNRDFEDERRPIPYERPETPYDMGADELSGRVGINGAACAYGLIQRAVDAAGSGDTLQAAVDVFTETVSITTGLNITIAGGYSADCTTGIAGRTTVNADGAGSVFEIHASVVTLRDLDITGGNNTDGGGLNAEYNARVMLDNTDVFANQAEYGGGIYLSNDGVLTFTHGSDIQHNTATEYGGGVSIFSGKLVGNDWTGNISDNTAPNGGGVYVSYGILELNGPSIWGNQATNPYFGRGGGIYVSSSVITVTGSANISSNSAHEGAGIYAYGHEAKIRLSGAVIHDNVAAADGGGVLVDILSTLEADNCIFYNNQAAGNGGGLKVANDSTLEADNCVFFNNRAEVNGGAIAAEDSTLSIHASYPAISRAPGLVPGLESLQFLLAAPCNPLIQPCSSFFSNVADSNDSATGFGGAIYAHDSTLNVAYTYLHNNRAVGGGALFQDGAAAVMQVSNTLIYSNTATIAPGAGIYTLGGAITVTHTTIANNVGGAGFSGAASAVFNSIGWGNTNPGFDTAPGMTSCNIDDAGLAGEARDPQFVAPGAGEDYHLLSTSPAVDACATGSSPDLDNVPRPHGSAYDMGAFEYYIPSFDLYLPLVRRAISP